MTFFHTHETMTKPLRHFADNIPGCMDLRGTAKFLEIIIVENSATKNLPDWAVKTSSNAEFTKRYLAQVDQFAASKTSLNCRTMH